MHQMANTIFNKVILEQIVASNIITTMDSYIRIQVTVTYKCANLLCHTDRWCLCRGHRTERWLHCLSQALASLCCLSAANKQTLASLCCLSAANKQSACITMLFKCYKQTSSCITMLFKCYKQTCSCITMLFKCCKQTCSCTLCCLIAANKQAMVSNKVVQDNELEEPIGLVLNKSKVIK